MLVGRTEEDSPDEKNEIKENWDEAEGKGYGRVCGRVRVHRRERERKRGSI